MKSTLFCNLALHEQNHISMFHQLSNLYQLPAWLKTAISSYRTRLRPCVSAGAYGVGQSEMALKS